ncbi:MAG: hypothetical protein H7X80_08610, partial [bacterium]|nr:hypothetical protein [Candidatus Kapabacteria bacterium]
SKHVLSVINNDVYEYVAGEWIVRGHIDHLYSNGGDRFVLRNNVLLASTNHGIIRSTNLGATWDTVAIAGMMSNTKDGFIIVSGMEIHASTDGVAWTQLGTLPDRAGSPVFFNGSVFASEFYGSQLFRSDDMGQTWRSAEFDLPLHNREAVAGAFIALHATGDALYAIAGAREILKSTDANTWTNITYNLPEHSIIQNVVGTSRELIVDVNTTGLFRLSNASWMPLDVPLISSIATAGDDFIFAARSGVHRVRAESGVVESLNHGLIRGPAFGMGSIGEYVLASTLDGIHRTTDRGDHWAKVADFGSWQSGGFVNNGSTLYTIDGIAYVSRDSGATWQMTGPEFDFEWEGPPFRNDVRGIDAYNGDVYLGVGTYLTGGKGGSGWSSGGMFRSSDDGATWTDVSNNLPRDMFSYAPTGSVIAKDGFVLIVNASGVYRSSNRGASWQRSMRGLPSMDPYGAGEMIDAGDHIVLRMGLSYFVSTDGGQMWLPMPQLGGYYHSGTFAALDGRMYTQAYRDPGADVSYSLFEFDGAAWADVSSTQPEGITFGSFVRAGDYVYAGSWANGVWRMRKEESQTSSVSTPSLSTRSTSIGAYPNPADTRTTIRFAVAARSHVRVAIVSSIGEHVATVHDGVLDAGTHDREASTEALLAGTYMVQLVVDGDVAPAGVLVVR